MGLYSQFYHRPEDIAGFISARLAACVIYPAVLGAWMYVAFVLMWPLAALVGASLVFLIALVGSCKLAFKDVKLKPEPHRQTELSEKKDTIDPHVPVVVK